MTYTESDLDTMLRNPAVRVHGLKPQRNSVVGAEIKAPPARKMTKAEREAGHMLTLEFPGCAVKFHGLAIYLACGHRYTMDWCVHLPDGQILCVEVKQRGKNGFRQQSYRSARIAFDQARIERSMFQWRWMEKHQGIWSW
jgi:hypothetical protein